MDRLQRLIAPRCPLSGDNDWAIASDMAVCIASHILEYKPGIVLELGSGLSTLVIGYALEKAGRGRLVSIEHSRRYYDDTMARLHEHGLQDKVKLRHCPLAPWQGGQPWYALPKNLTSMIDLLIVDGPPGNIAREARYPALPALWERLSPDAVVMADDTRRKEDMDIIHRWLKEFPLSHEFLATQKGTSILTRIRE